MNDKEMLEHYKESKELLLKDPKITIVTKYKVNCDKNGNEISREKISEKKTYHKISKADIKGIKSLNILIARLEEKIKTNNV